MCYVCLQSPVLRVVGTERVTRVYRIYHYINLTWPRSLFVTHPSVTAMQLPTNVALLYTGVRTLLLLKFISGVDMPPQDGQFWIAGDIFMRKYYVAFDYGQGRLGMGTLWDMFCLTYFLCF